VPPLAGAPEPACLSTSVLTQQTGGEGWTLDSAVTTVAITTLVEGTSATVVTG
jgi:hypothetical protein